MKILQVINSFPPAWATGGPAQMAYNISKELVDRGHEVTVYTGDVCDATSRVPQARQPTEMDGIQLYRFRNLSNRLAYKNVPLTFGMALALRSNVDKYDVVHAHLYRCVQSIFVHRYACKRDIPYILQPRGALPLLSKSRPKLVFDKLFGHSIVRDASKIIASSRIESGQFRDVFVDFPVDKVVHMPNYIDLASYADLPQRGQFRRKHNIGERAKVVLFLSRLHERKGADLLVAAFSKLKRTVDFPVTLVIAGPDEGYLQTLKSLAKRLMIENEVLFPGLLQGREKLEAYVDADVFVLPAKDRYESFGNVVLEALACGTPVIVTNNCGVSEWIGKDVGYVIDYDETALYDTLNEVLLCGDLGKTLGHTGKELIKNEFDLHKGILRLEELYEVVVSENWVQNTDARHISS
jgi:glycosyltransferase involved in cell wall biosynthesis